MDLRRAVVRVPGEWTGLSAARNAEIFAVENMFAQRAPLLFQEPRRNSPSVSAVALSRIQVGSSLAQALQNGSVRLHAVDTWQSAPAGGAPASAARCDQILGSRAASSATIQPSTVRPRIESSLLGSASTRDPFSSSRP